MGMIKDYVIVTIVYLMHFVEKKDKLLVTH